MSNAPHTWPRLFVANQLIEEDFFELSLEQSRYLTQVMRLREGDYVRVFNGLDGDWKASLNQMGKGKKNGVILRTESRLRRQEAEPDLWLCAAPIKRNHFDFTVMKATELGVCVIQPIITSRTQVRDINIERARTIAIEAAEQSERLTIPEIREPVTLVSYIESWTNDRLAVLCAEYGDAQPIAQAFSGPLAQTRPKAAIFTGPEGGFAPDEMEKLRSLPEILPVRLGPRILRADTAALAALSCWQALCGDWPEKNDAPERV